jgi:regulator of sirC expression with transglutaminase-like and TPR domain
VLPSRAAFDDSPEFLRLLRGSPGTDLARVGLEIARDAYPRLDPEPYLARIDALADRARERCASLDRPHLVLGQINWVLFVEEGYQGNANDYYDPRNSYLNEVIDRRTGIPISLSVLYLRLAERLGLRVAGVNLPAHFLLRVDRGDSTVFVDPFHSGALLDRDGCRRQVARLLGPEIEITEGHLAPCPAAVVVARMLRNLKAIYLQNHEYTSAIPVQRRLAALLHGDPEEQRDLGMLLLRADRPGEAVEPLQSYVDSRPPRPDAEHIHALLRAARRDAALRN